MKWQMVFNLIFFRFLSSGFEGPAARSPRALNKNKAGKAFSNAHSCALRQLLSKDPTKTMQILRFFIDLMQNPIFTTTF